MAPEGEYVAIAAGCSHSLALRSDGTIIGWGNNEYSQATPPEGNDFIAIAAGHHQSLAIRKEPTVQTAEE
jgi:alpha-tubulin suppressor-like RCC1 family protein